jgi:hypothetical protein
MKKLLLFLLLAGCAEPLRSPQRRQDLHFGDHVKIINGFYAGQEGTVVDEDYFMESDGMPLLVRGYIQIPSFVIQIVYFGIVAGKEVKIAQDNLEKVD